MPPKPQPTPPAPVLTSTLFDKYRARAVGCQPSSENSRHRIIIIPTEPAEIITIAWQELQVGAKTTRLL